MLGYISKIETLGLHDGPGIRLVIFMSGCPLRCIYCHNPEMFKLKNGKISTPEELVRFVLEYKTYFNSGGGVTFSGGEPLTQDAFLLQTCKLLKQHNINIAIDTCGIGLKNEELLKYIDLIIMDIKALKKDAYLKITGTDHFDDSIKFLQKCRELNINLWFRQVIVPGINDHKGYIKELKTFINNYPYQNIELLPYHTMAKAKYSELGINYKLTSIQAMDIKKIEELNKLLKN